MDNTPRIPGNRDEGIVQPVPKGADKLSRRLHHWPMAAGVTPGGHLFYPSRMARYATVRALSLTEAAYVAGIVDGEGTITLTTMHAGENRRLVVSVSSTERYLLEFLIKTVGAGRITSKRTYSSKHAPSFAFRVTNRQALGLLRHITPYLQTTSDSAPPLPCAITWR